MGCAAKGEPGVLRGVQLALVWTPKRGPGLTNAVPCDPTEDPDFLRGALAKHIDTFVFPCSSNPEHPLRLQIQSKPSNDRTHVEAQPADAVCARARTVTICTNLQGHVNPLENDNYQTPWITIYRQVDSQAAESPDEVSTISQVSTLQVMLLSLL